MSRVGKTLWMMDSVVGEINNESIPLGEQLLEPNVFWRWLIL